MGLFAFHYWGKLPASSEISTSSKDMMWFVSLAWLMLFWSFWISLFLTQNSWLYCSNDSLKLLTVGTLWAGSLPSLICELIRAVRAFSDIKACWVAFAALSTYGPTVDWGFVLYWAWLFFFDLLLAYLLFSLSFIIFESSPSCVYPVRFPYPV